MFTLLLIVTLCATAYAQPVKQGIATKRIPSALEPAISTVGIVTRPAPHQVGDTLSILGTMNSPERGKVFLYRDSAAQDFVSVDRVTLLEKDLSFWEKAWFEQRMSMELKGKWPLKAIATMDQYSLLYIAGLHEASMIVEEDLLNDYLHSMLLRIFPDTLIKSRPRSLHVWVVHSLWPAIFSFDNGAVILSTGLLCRVQSEWELENALARQVAHIVLDHQISNAVNPPTPGDTGMSISAEIMGEYMSHRKEDNLTRWQDTHWPNPEYPKALGAIFTNQQKHSVHKIAKDYMALRYPGGPPEITPADSHRFTLVRSVALMRNAWKLHDLRRYAEAVPLVDSLIATGAATGEAYLLRAKIQRMMHDSPDHNRQALAWLQLAREKDISGLPEIEREMALLRLRLGDKTTARQLLEQYIARLQALDPGAFAADITSARELILKLEKL